MTLNKWITKIVIEFCTLRELCSCLVRTGLYLTDFGLISFVATRVIERLFVIEHPISIANMITVSCTCGVVGDAIKNVG